MKVLRSLAIVASVAIAVVMTACGGDDDDAATETPAAGGSASQSYDEGEVRLEIEYLDTGLLKGHAYGDAVDGWVVEAIRVEAADHEGTGWPVIEPERTGIGSRNASEFFEVTIQELPRGEQIAVTTTVTFHSEGGLVAERTATDNWPP